MRLGSLLAERGIEKVARLGSYEVVLDGEDGLNWETFCDCSILWSLDIARLNARRGHVILERRSTIRLFVREKLRLSATDC